MDKASQVALNSARNIERSFTAMGTAIAGATTAVVGALGVLIDKTEETVFQMQKMSQQAGVSIESFSKLSYAAKVAGMPVDQLAVILTRISHSSFEAASGSLQAKEAYQDLGIKVQDTNGHFKTADTLMLELAKKLDGYRDSSAKTGIETMIMGRSGAQAAEMLKVLATRYDEISAKAERLGVVFNMQTAVQSQKLHDSFVDLEEASLGLSVRLLNAVSPALDQLADKIVAFVSNADNMKMVGEIGQDIANGVQEAGSALEFLIDHASMVKAVLEGLLAIRVAGWLGPMIASGAAASGVFGKLGIASLNLAGKLLGVQKMGTVVGPALANAATSAVSYTTALGGLAKTEGAAATASLALSDALSFVATQLAWAAPLAAVAVGLKTIYDDGMAIYKLNDQLKESGKSWLDDWAEKTELLNNRMMSIKGLMATLAIPGLSGLKAAGDAMNDYRSLLASKQILGNAKMAKAPGLPQGYNPETGKMDEWKDNLGALPQPEKVDQLKKKLEELAENARNAKVALSLVGTSPQAQQDAEIIDKYNKFLIEEDANLKKLSPTKQEAARIAAYEAITTAVNTEALTKYNTELYNLSQTTAESIVNHLAMAEVIGKSAKAMQEAQVSAQVNKAFSKYGPNWQSDPKRLADSQLYAAQVRADLTSENLEADTKSAASTQMQVDAQQRLTAAIMQGAEARRQAQIVNEQEAVRQDFMSRGDTDTGAMQAQIDAIRQKSDADKEAADLQRAASMDATMRYHEQITALNDATIAAEKHGQAIDFRSVLAADKEAWLQYEQAQDKAILATGSMVDGFKVALQQMARDAESTAQLTYEAFTNAVNSMNDTIAKVATEKHHRGTHDIRNQFSGSFRGIGDNLMKASLQKGESALLKGFGIAGKPDGSSQNPWYVRVVNSLSGGKTGVLGSVTSAMPQTTSATGGALNQIAGIALQSLPFLADGGFLDGNSPAIIGENGPELFVPNAAGTVMPNSRLDDLGGGHTFNIDARGATDPAQTVMMIQQALKMAAPQITHQSVRAMQEQSARTPTTGRRA